MKRQAGYTLMELIVALGAIGFFGAVLFVLTHFIIKFW